jgi:F420-dependent oxidoreductase-like protein
MRTSTPVRHLTRFGLVLTNYSYGLPSERLFRHVVDVVRAAEASGFDSIWLPDHVVQGPAGDLHANDGGPIDLDFGPNGPREPILDAPTTLAALAAVTTRIRLGQLVSPVTMRNPALLAKMITTLDVISGGRAHLGIGGAWDVDEHRRYGFEFPPAKERLDRLEDAVQICRAMFDHEAATFSGTHHSIDEAINVPRPVNPHIPILIGGTGEKRTLRIAAQYADACNPNGDVAEMRHKIEVMERHCEDVGRDPAEVSRPGGVLFNKLGDDLLRGVENVFTAGCDGVILMPWQLALQPDELAEIGSRLTAEFGICAA